MEELTTSTQETEPTQSTSARKWYEGVSLEDAEIYIRANLKSAARSVIAIGYYLKCVNRNELFKEAGYKDICEYAKDRFGFSTSTTSRYMSRNDKFSVDGNSPILDEKYKDFNKSQLQEMLSLDAEQLEQVTPDMTVVQIREMRKPKEIPYIEMPGQIELTDFPGVDPKDVAASVQARAEMQSSQPEKQTYTISAEDLLPEPAQPEREQPVAISQQKELITEPQSAVTQDAEKSGEAGSLPEKSGKCIHRPEFKCTLEEAHKLIPGTGEDCSRVCCWECVRRGNCELECYSSQRRPEHLEPPKTEPDCPPLDAADVQQGKTAIPSQEECVLDFYQHHMSKPCAQAVNDGNAKLLRQELISNHGENHNSGSTEYGFYQCGPERIHFQDNMCETFLSLTWGKYVKELLSLLGSAEDEASEHENDVPGMPESQDTVIDGEFTEIPETEEDIRAPEEPMTELQIAQDELERAKKLLNDGLKCDVDENDIHIRRLKIKVCALASYVCDLDDIVNPPKPEQPELPLLKNNDQRAAFVDAYETWPLWIETKQTGERYYRYDLEDGTSMVVKVYHARIFDGYAPGSYEAKYHDGYGRHEYYLLRDGKFFRDCDTNRSLLIEKLKEIQKVKKGCNQN